MRSTTGADNCWHMLPRRARAPRHRAAAAAPPSDRRRVHSQRTRSDRRRPSSQVCAGTSSRSRLSLSRAVRRLVESPPTPLPPVFSASVVALARVSFSAGFRKSDIVIFFYIVLRLPYVAPRYTTSLCACVRGVFFRRLFRRILSFSRTRPGPKSRLVIQ